MKDDVGKSDVAKGAARTDEAGVSTKETDATAEIQQKSANRSVAHAANQRILLGHRDSNPE
ncbi:MAG: hypothetical protein D8B56_03330 [Alloprevotella sp.]|nr:MAG: hypothetical protein D8B56_03330 [Alloprevotella sp.]